MSAVDLAQRVDVRHLNFAFPTDDPAEGRKRLWDAFANNPHERSFRSVELTKDTQLEYWTVLANEIVRRAKEFVPSTEPLERFLSEIQPNGVGHRLPVSCYLVRTGRGSAWVIVCKWEVSSNGPMAVSHVHLWAIDSESGRVLAEARCD